MILTTSSGGSTTSMLEGDCIEAKDLNIMQVVDTPEDVVRIIKKFYTKKHG